VRKKTFLDGAVFLLFMLTGFPPYVFSMEVKVSQTPPTNFTEGKYMGSKACESCHPAHYRKWFLSPHAKAYRSLKGTEKNDSRCLRCHTTGFRGQDNPEPSLTGVQCEACHGPSSRHAADGTSSPVPTPNFDCRDCEIRKICMPCHTPKKSPGFDFNRYYERIRHDDNHPEPE
jgi:hypothetical protein